MHSEIGVCEKQVVGTSKFRVRGSRREVSGAVDSYLPTSGFNCRLLKNPRYGVREREFKVPVS